MIIIRENIYKEGKMREWEWRRKRNIYIYINIWNLINFLRNIIKQNVEIREILAFSAGLSSQVEYL